MVLELFLTYRIAHPTLASFSGFWLVISPDFPLELKKIFPGELVGKHFIRFLVLTMKDFRTFVLHNFILIFDSEQVYLKPQVSNLKSKEVTVNPKLQTLDKIGFSKTLNPNP